LPAKVNWLPRSEKDVNLGCTGGGCSKCRSIKRIETLPKCTACFVHIDPSGIPDFLGCCVLSFGIRPNQTGINDHAFVAHQSFRKTSRNRRFEHVAQQVTLAETPLPVR